ncbi:protein Vhl [Lutzomyia longipalpis]|uniref:protein Vhl n=1 Tax=Lutzomyia longipalpis TaxID=7200 RepID=UPI002483FF25|nr:protein Vhl [Lutzomyia longipalpis]
MAAGHAQIVAGAAGRVPAELPALRSGVSSHRAFVLFHNTSNRHVELFWINYSGQRASYGILQPDEKRKIDTFVSHPWCFVDAYNLTKFLVNGQEVFFPVVWYEGSIDLVRMMIKRQIARIHAPVRPLREICMERVAMRLPNTYAAHEIEVPASISQDIEQTFKELKEKPQQSTLQRLEQLERRNQQHQHD